jgi:hypothetical protein
MRTCFWSSKLLYDWLSVSQYALVSSTLRDLQPDITSCRYVAVLFVWGALSDERTGLQFAVQSLNAPSRAELETILYCLIWDSPNLEGQVPVFISPRNRVAQLYPRALGSLYAVSYDSRGYSGGILTLPQPGGPGPRIYIYIYIYIPQEQGGSVQSESKKSKSRYDRRSVSQSMSWCLVHVASEGLHPNEFQSNVWKGTLRRNFWCYHWEGCTCEACSATWNLGTNSAFALGPRKTTENLDRVGR